MHRYSTWLTIVDTIEDSRLARAVVTPKCVTFEHRAGHLSPPLAQDLGEFLRHLSQSGLTRLDLSRLGTPPASDNYIVRVPDQFMGDALFTLRQGICSGRPFQELRVRASMMSREVVDELNEYVLPDFFGAVLPSDEVLAFNERVASRNLLGVPEL